MAQPVTAVRDWLGKEYPLQATISYDFEVNGNQSVSATILPSEVNRRFIADITEMWTVIDHFGVEQKIVYLQRRGQGEEQSVQIKGIPLFFDVMNSDRIYERVDKHMTAMEAFTRIFENTGFTFVLADSFDAVEWEGFGEGETHLESFKRALDRYGAEFYIRGKQVTLKKLIGNDLQTMYAHRLNASNITLEHDASALWTYAKGFGDYGDGEGSEDWQDAKLVREYTSPLAKIIGIRHAPPLKNGNITTVATMDEQLKTLVDESLKISVTADIHDLRKQGYPIGQPEVGDRVYLVDERIGFNEQVRVVDMKLVLDWRGDVRDISLTFGTPGLSRRYQARVSSAMGAITDLLDGKIKLPPSSVYDDAMRNAVTAIQNAQTELQFPVQGGIIAVDKNDPNKQVWYNSAGFMVSKDGGATAEAAITGEGVVAEKIVGRTIIGVNLTSADNTGYFTVNGPNAEFYDMLTRRSLTMAPGGIYGLNADGTTRFQADRTLVTSTALGTSLSNVYLAAQSGFEARVVDMVSIPGDGAVHSYDYLPLRAQIYRFPNLPHGYFTLLNGGEFRFTGEQTSNPVYQNIRVNGAYANFVDAHGDTAYPNLYIRPLRDGEVRLTRSGTTDDYIDVRGKYFHGSRVVLSSSFDGVIHFHVQPAGDGEVRITARADSTAYRPVRARDFITDTSDRENKTDIVEYEADTLDVLRNANVYNYRRMNDEPDAPMQLGLMIDEMPEVTHSETGDSFALYALAAYTFKAVKDTLAKVDQLEKRIEQLEGATT